MEKIKCYIYTRVSTSIQIEGYSLDAQKDEIYKYIKAYDYEVAGEYSDEGKSGKNIEGRPQFRQMLHDIESKKDDVKFVLVYKLSRFGRNAADVLREASSIFFASSELIAIGFSHITCLPASRASIVI